MSTTAPPPEHGAPPEGAAARALTIEEMVVPDSVDGPGAADLHVLVALNNAVCRSDTGVDDFSGTAEEMLALVRGNADETCRAFLARRGGRVVGACTLEYADAEPSSGSVDVMVLPQHWGAGVERALLERAEYELRALGRSSLQAWTLHRPEDTRDALVPRTGWGRISATAHARLLHESGFALEQVERSSALDLRAPLDGIRHALDDALAVAGSDYRLVEWTLPTPQAWQEGYAWALSRMSTDVPAGGLDIDEERWDVDRLRRREQKLRDGSQTMSVSAVEHVPTGTLAAFNELVIGEDPTGVTHQYSTLVLREHRGHRLGTIVKCANILRWRSIAPHSPRISTFNAEENRPMLRINEALGFAPVCCTGAWQKRLT